MKIGRSKRNADEYKIIETAGFSGKEALLFPINRYTFTNRCHEKPGLEMNDGTTKIILNAMGNADDIDPKLKAFLDYVAGKPASDDYTKKLEDAVKKARLNKEWRRQYMTMMMRNLENQEIGEKNKETDVAEKMLAEGEPTDKIIRYTGITETSLQEIAARLGLTITVTTKTVTGESKS